MDGLRTTRVLVIDNDAEEASGITKALAKQGIGAVYFSQDLSLLPERPLHGIRLAALDMNLADTDTSNATAAVGPTLSVLERLVDKRNGPYLAIAWTKHPDLIEEFKERVAELACPPVAVIPLVKADVKDDQDAFDFDKIAASVQLALNGVYPLGLLAFWEQMLHESSSSIMEMISGEDGWMDGGKQTVALLLGQSAGENDPQDVKLRALLEAFNFLQFDAIEASTALVDLEQANQLVKPLEAIGELPRGSALAARLNRRLLCGTPLPDAAPGNVYQPEVITAKEANVFPTLDELLCDIAQKDKEQELKDAGCLAVAMEISPLCDYQQRKVKRARFICGVAVVQEKRNLLKQQGDFIRSTPMGREAVIAFDDGPLNGNRIILWNCHYIVSVPPDQVPRGGALHRLRQLPLMDIQAWAGSHASRPGYLSVQ